MRPRWRLHQWLFVAVTVRKMLPSKVVPSKLRCEAYSLILTRKLLERSIAQRPPLHRACQHDKAHDGRT